MASGEDLGGMASTQNASNLQYDKYAMSLNTDQTGCYAPGALPVPLASNDTCILGFYCPNSSDDAPPQYCPPVYQCTIFRANAMTCNPQGDLEPMLCSAGYYCPEGGKQRLECPAGSFCPQGSFEPIPCDAGALCPRMSSRQISLAPLWLVIVIDVAVVISMLFGFAVSTWRRRQRAAYTSLGMNANADDVEVARDKLSLDSTRESQDTTRNSRDSTRGSREVSAGSPGFLSSRFPSPPLPPRASKIPDLAFPSSPMMPQGRAGRVRSSSMASSLPPSPRVRAHSAAASSVGGFIYDDLPDLDDIKNPQMQKFLTFLSRAMGTKEMGLSFEFEKLSYETTKGRKKILTDVNGSMPSGSMWGIMGGSGAGKSTFMNVLMGKQRVSSGVIRINGWIADMHKYKKLIGYVPQDDIVLPELTVRENLLHSARMRLPSTWRDKLIQEFVDSLIGCLALTHVQDSVVGDVSKPVISGGQRKRVSIGVELAAAPMAIFLDEPTSGLDATSAGSVMRLLKAISHLGVTVISIIHQPREDIWRGFDQLLLLAQGRQVYAGETEGVLSYFESMGYSFAMRGNPADALMDIITGDGARYSLGDEKSANDVSYLIDFWQSKGRYGRLGKHLSVDVTNKKTKRISGQSMQSTLEQEESLTHAMKVRGASWPAQVYYCCKRSLTQQICNRTSFLFEVGVGGLAGVIIGLSAFSSEGHLFQGIIHPPFTALSSAVNYDSVPQMGLLTAMAIGLAASAPGVWVFGEEKLIFYRESASGHSRSAYYLGKVLSTLPRIALSALHYTVFMGILATPRMSFGEMYGANVMYFYAIYGLASMISMCVKREDGPLLSVLASLILGVLGGVAPPLSRVRTWHMEWFWRLSPGVWFTEAYFSQNLLPSQHIYILELASQSIGLKLGEYTKDILLVMAIGTVYRVIAYVLLVLLHRSKQR